MGTVSALHTETSDSSPSMSEQPLSADELRKMDAYWRAGNYCCVGMLYRRANPVLREPLKVEHIKNRTCAVRGRTDAVAAAQRRDPDRGRGTADEWKHLWSADGPVELGGRAADRDDSPLFRRGPVAAAGD